MRNYLKKHIEQLINEKAFESVDDPQTLLTQLETLLFKRAIENTVTVDVKTYRILKVLQDDEILLMNAIEQSPKQMLNFQGERGCPL